MLRFKQYIAEIGVDPFKMAGKPAWTESLSTMLFDLPRAGIKDVKIPLSPAIMRRIWPKPVRTTVFHLTDYTGLGKLKKMQGGKRSISAFFNTSIISQMKYCCTWGFRPYSFKNCRRYWNQYILQSCSWKIK